MKKTLGQGIRELRQRKDISLREFARKMGITASHQSDIELGRRFPSDALLARFADAFGVPVENLQQHDNRVPLEQIRRIIQADPAFGFALRTVIDKEVNAEDLLELSKKRRKRESNE